MTNTGTKERWTVEGFVYGRTATVGKVVVEADTRYKAVKAGERRGLDVFSAKRHNPMSGGGLKGHH